MRRTIWLALSVALIVSAVAGIAYGAVPLPLGALLAALRGHGDPMMISIVHDLRLPRVTMAILVGAGLGMSGAALQGSLRNALAEPYLLGVSGGAAVGAVIATLSGVQSPIGLPLASFGGAALAITATLLVARAAGGRADSRVMLMAGVVIGAFANAAIMVLLANASPDVVRGALWWMMGSVADASWTRVRWTALYLAMGGAALLWFAGEIDVLALGEEPAAALGLDADRAARRVFILSAMIAAVTVAAAGLVGFVGLVVPHIARGAPVRGHRELVALSALTGGALVVTADLAARIALPPAELPLGAVTALVGVPFFLAQLRRLG